MLSSRNYIAIVFILLFASSHFLACQGTKDQSWKHEVEAWQDTMNMNFADPEHSPLDSIALEKFTALKFFRINEKYKLNARFVRTPNESPFGMKTSTERLPVYIKYGEAYFELDGEKCKLNIYQNQELITRKDYEKYLFLPFLDATSGVESYKGGRYLDLRIPEGDSISIDFNKAYNPYCAYNHKYSCPIPPYENQLKIAIEAGVKKYKQDR
jgi:uncharacterized protein (DUF1684 family)